MHISLKCIFCTKVILGKVAGLWGQPLQQGLGINWNFAWRLMGARQVFGCRKLIANSTFLSCSMATRPPRLELVVYTSKLGGHLPLSYPLLVMHVLLPMHVLLVHTFWNSRALVHRTALAPFVRWVNYLTHCYFVHKTCCPQLISDRSPLTCFLLSTLF